MQEQGLMSSVPLGLNLIPIKRALTTTSTANFCAIYHTGIVHGGRIFVLRFERLSNNMIMVDRKKLKNPNGLILGTPGSGKSFSAKREITNAFFCHAGWHYYRRSGRRILCPLVNALWRAGYPYLAYQSRLHQSNWTSTWIILMMITRLGFKSDFILSLCELIMGSRNGIEAEEKSVIDRCLPIVYQK